MSDKRILTFEDLVFKKHSTIGVPEVSASIKFKNGGWILVFPLEIPLESGVIARHNTGYEWYELGRNFEVMSSETETDTLFYLTADEVTEHMIGIQMRVL
jgi:hypothetical protein